MLFATEMSSINTYICVYIFAEPITFVDPQNVQSVKENDNAVIKCMVTGDPEPSITWYYNGQPLNSNVYLLKVCDFTIGFFSLQIFFF